MLPDERHIRALTSIAKDLLSLLDLLQTQLDCIEEEIRIITFEHLTS